MQSFLDQLQMLLGLGLEVGNVGAGQMAIRTVLIYIFTLAIVRLGSKRFLSESTAFDVIIGIMLGSVMSRAINGSAPFVPTLLSGVVLVGLHWLITFLAYRIDWFGPIVKGNPVMLIKDGQIQQRAMRQTGLSTRDLEQAIRQEAQQMDLAGIRYAYLERSGSISVISYPPEPHVISVPVEDGVQTVRIEIT